MSVSLEKEYEMLVGELRQNRMIQLQTFLATPIWVSLFLGLLGAEAHNVFGNANQNELPIS